ncbi:MAG: DUF2937 family protein [Pseudomonadota bacterium]
MLRSYLRLALFALGLLVGVQVPGFIDDYAQSVAAHRSEAEESLQGFRLTAQRFFNDDLQALVVHYRASADPVMLGDAENIAHLVARADRLESEWLRMQGPWHAQVWHLAVAADRALLDEVYQAYRFQLLLAPEAIAWGLACALLLAWLVELLLLGAGWTLGYGRTHRLIRNEKRLWH